VSKYPDRKWDIKMEMTSFKSLLKELSRLTIVVGSYARNEQHPTSDLDLLIKSDSEYFIQEIIDILESYEVCWDSCWVNTINTLNTPIQLDMSTLFKVSKNPDTFKINILGIEFDAIHDIFNMNKYRSNL